MSEAEIIKAFEDLDSDKTGSIKTSDLRQFMETFGSMSGGDIDKMISDCGAGSSVDYVKFVQEMNKKVQKAEAALNDL